MKLWRIAASTRSYGAADLTGTGAGLSPGRWNSEGVKAVYCAPTRAMAVLETAAHVDTNGFPLNRFLVEISVPDDVWAGREVTDSDSLDPQWSAIPAGFASADFGTGWVLRGATALIELPSVIVHEESVVLINPAHPDAAKIAAKVVRKLEYDALFRRQPAGPINPRTLP